MDEILTLSTNKEWFIMVESSQIGPLSLHDLKEDARLNPNTLVWRQGFDKWIEARFVTEFDAVFKDENVIFSPEDTIEEPLTKNVELTPDLSALVLDRDPSPIPLWTLFFIFIIIYAIARIYF